MAIFLGTRIPYPNMNCHPDRSVAKWRDLLFSPPATDAHESVALPFVIRSACDFFRPFAFFVPDQMFFGPLHKIVILRACDFFDFPAFLHPTRYFQSPRKRRHPERSASQIYRITQGFMARSRRTPAMFVRRCSSE